MRTKLLFLAALACAVPAPASTPACEILLPKATFAGGLLLAAGQYQVWVSGSSAVFVDVASRRSFATAVEVENTKPHDVSNVAVARRGDTRVLKTIDLAGTDETLEFADSVSDSYFVQAR